jgi:hypothetical protein
MVAIGGLMSYEADGIEQYRLQPAHRGGARGTGSKIRLTSNQAKALYLLVAFNAFDVTYNVTHNLWKKH